MRCWRIAKRQYALDTSCLGARDMGGRWNPVGMSALYAGSNVEICALEKFVPEGIAVPLVLVAIDLPDDPGLGYAPPLTELPPDWNAMPAPVSSQRFGAVFLQAASHLYMRVPSVVVPEATNLVINPLHPAYGQIKLAIARPFAFDSRMFR